MSQGICKLVRANAAITPGGLEFFNMTEIASFY